MLQRFYNAKSVFLEVIASLCWLSNISSVYLVLISLLLIGQQGSGTFLSVSALSSHWLEEFAICTLTLEENDKIQYSANHS